MVQEVIVWANGMVMVFDEQGNQKPDLQWPRPNLKEIVLKACNEGTTFYKGIWGRQITQISLVEFMETELYLRGANA